MKKWLSYLLLLFFWFGTGFANAQLSIGGTQPGTVQTGIANTVSAYFWHGCCLVLRWIGDFFSTLLSMIYGYLSEALFVVPDFTNQAFFYSAQNTANAVVPVASAWQAIVNLTHVFQYLGFFILVISFTIYVGKQALGLNAQSFSILTVLRLLFPAILIFVWPYITSWMASITTSLSFYIYNQCPNNVNNVFSSLTSSQNIAPAITSTISTSTITGQSYTPLNTLDMRAAFTTNMGTLISVIFWIGICLCILGFFYGLSKISSGKEDGLKIIGGALIGFFFIFFASQIVTFFSTGGGALTGLANPNIGVAVPGTGLLPQGYAQATTPVNVQPGTAVASAPTPGPSVPSPFTNINTATTGPADQYDTANDTFNNLLNSLMRFIICLWGVFIIISILLAKGFQLIMIFVLIFLGYPAIGLYGNPATEAYPQSFFKLFVKYHLYCPMWALALVALNLLAGLNWSVISGSAVGVFATSFMILGGLTLVQNSQDLAALFTTSAGGTGGTASNFMKDAMSVIRTAGIAGQALTSPFMQQMAGHAGGATGALAGGVVGAAGGLIQGVSAPTGGPQSVSPTLLTSIASGASSGAGQGFNSGKILSSGGSKALNMVSNSLAGDAGKPIPGSGGGGKAPATVPGISNVGSHLQTTVGDAVAAAIPPAIDPYRDSHTSGYSAPAGNLASSNPPNSGDPFHSPSPSSNSNDPYRFPSDAGFSGPAVSPTLSTKPLSSPVPAIKPTQPPTKEP